MITRNHEGKDEDDDGIGHDDDDDDDADADDAAAVDDNDAVVTRILSFNGTSR